MDVKQRVILAVLMVSLIILAWLFFRGSPADRTPQGLTAPLIEPDNASLETPQTMTVVLFFLSEKDPYLHKEERLINAETSLLQQAKQTIEELVRGSASGLISPFPPDTKLREMYLTPDGTAYVDFSQEIERGHLSGASAEIATVYAVVNSLTYNFNSIKRVFILVDGGEKETLSGHVDLSRPFLPRYNLVVN